MENCDNLGFHNNETQMSAPYALESKVTLKYDQVEVLHFWTVWKNNSIQQRAATLCT